MARTGPERLRQVLVGVRERKCTAVGSVLLESAPALTSDARAERLARIRLVRQSLENSSWSTEPECTHETFQRLGLSMYV